MDRGDWWTTVHGVARELDMTDRLTLTNLSHSKWNTQMSGILLQEDMKLNFRTKKGVYVFMEQKPSSQNHRSNPWSVEKMSSTKLVPGAKKFGDHWFTWYEYSELDYT